MAPCKLPHVGRFLLLCLLLSVGATHAGPRTKALDFDGESWGAIADCGSEVGGTRVTLGDYTLAGYDNLYSLGATYGCYEQTGLVLGDDPFELDPVIASLMAPGTTLVGKRFTFYAFTTDNPDFVVPFDFFDEPTLAIFQWEIYYFKDAMIASLLGPWGPDTDGDFNSDPLAITDTSTYLEKDGNTIRGGLTHDFDDRYLCFNADATEFVGVVPRQGLESQLCTSDPNDGGGGGTEVPVPGTAGLLLLGLAGLGLVARRPRSTR